MSTSTFGKRCKFKIDLSGIKHDLRQARQQFDHGNYFEAFDVFEQICAAHPGQAVDILAEAYDLYQLLPQRDRFHLYQGRQFNFDIKPSDKVLDIGSGHLPFPLATHLSDLTLDDHGYGRAAAPFKYVKGKPVFECNIENMSFGDKEFDFVYCSHVLEHTHCPQKACEEIMRVAKRGYIETPTRGKDIFLNSAGISNHTHWIEAVNGTLIFTPYRPDEIKGLQCDILLRMHTAPQSKREKAFSALIYLKPQLFNTMFLWDGTFDYEVRKCNPLKNTASIAASAAATRNPEHPQTPGPALSGIAPLPADPGPDRFSHPRPNPVMQVKNPEKALMSPSALNAWPAAVPEGATPSAKLLQIHTFYGAFLEAFYRTNPYLKTQPFRNQIDALLRDGFSAIHLFAPYMTSFCYDSHLIIANNYYAQKQWALENQVSPVNRADMIYQIACEQVNRIKPDILYLTDPITFDSKFIRGLSWKPKLVMGWRAADIPADTDWSEFDVIMSSLGGIREVALKLGAKASEHFFPGFPVWVNRYLEDVKPEFDVVFSGTWSSQQHRRRNQYLRCIARQALEAESRFSCVFYLNANNQALPADVARFNAGARFGIAMHRALRSGRIVIDGRGSLTLARTAADHGIDLAGRQTANMRIFEATGSGCFLLTECHDNLKQYFEPGVEIETYRDEKDLIEKIYYYLDNPAKRSTIAARGQQRCLNEYSMEKRAAEFDRIIARHMGSKPVPQFLPTHPVQEIKQHAEKMLEKDNPLEAFSLVIKAKSMKVPVHGLDYLRAMCFVRLNNFENALEAVREELRLFPANREAALLHDHLSNLVTSPEPDVADAEFNAVLKTIRPYTLLSVRRLYSLFTLAKNVCECDMPGHFVECGVAAGGSTALLAYTIKEKSLRPRKVYAFDTFEGMPAPTSADTHHGLPAQLTGWGSGTCYAPESSVREICKLLNVSDIIEPVKGLFQDTLPQMRSRIETVALLHMDGDWYDSTTTILANLYEHVIVGGYIQVDDFGHWDGCRKAVKEFEASRNLVFRINPIDGTGVWFTKPAPQR